MSTTRIKVNAKSAVTLTKPTSRRSSCRAVHLADGRHVGDVENHGRRLGWVYYGRHDGNAFAGGFSSRRQAVVALFKSDRRCRFEAALAGEAA